MHARKEGARERRKEGNKSIEQTAFLSLLDVVLQTQRVHGKDRGDIFVFSTFVADVYMHCLLLSPFN
jgi:hypothetical protein